MRLRDYIIQILRDIRVLKLVWAGLNVYDPYVTFKMKILTEAKSGPVSINFGDIAVMASEPRPLLVFWVKGQGHINFEYENND